MQSNPGGSAPAPNVPINIAAARTLDAVARSGPAPVPAPPVERGRMWPHVPWQCHAAFVVLAGLSILLAYSNSFGPKNRPAATNWTLDNKYIIELDPRTKVEADVFRPSTWKNPDGRPDFVDIWTRDYWWPKGISGLYRPVVTFTYWLNWYKMSGDENLIDPSVQQSVVDTIPIATQIQMLRDVNQTSGAPQPTLKSSASQDQFNELRAALRAFLVGNLPVTSQTDKNEIRRVDERITGELYVRVDMPSREKALRAIHGADKTLDEQLAKVSDVNQREAILRGAIRDKRTEPIVKERLLIFHIVNYWGHFITTILVYLLALHLTQRFWTAAAIGLLFGLHPVATETVTNIIGRADIFASITVIGGLLLYIRASLSRGLWKIPWLIALMLLTTVGVFSKESAIAVLPVCGLYDLIFRWMPRWDSNWVWDLSKKIFYWFVTGYIVLFPPIVAMFIARSRVFAASTPPETPFLDNPIRGVNWFAGEITALQVLVRLWSILIFPKDLCADYSFNQVPTFGYLSTPLNNILGLLAAALVIGVFVLAIYLWKRNKAASFFMLFFFVAFLPTSNLLITIGSIMAERFLYLPLVGFVGAFVLAIEWIVARTLIAIDSGDFTPLAARAPVRAVATVAAAPSGRESTNKPSPSTLDDLRRPSPLWIAPAMLLVIAMSYGIRTYFRNFAWQSDFTLWDAAKDISPNSFRSYQSYAFALFEEVQRPPEKRQPETKNVTIDECIKWIAKGRPIVDQLPDRYNSSRLYLHEGMYCGVKGESLCSRAADGSLVVTPDAVQWFRKSVETLEKGRAVDRAFNEINRQKEIERGKSIDIIPDAGLLQVYEYLGVSYFRLGDLDRALDNYFYMRHLDPWNADASEKIAMVYLQAGRNEQAAIALIQAIWLDGNRQHLWPAIERTLQQMTSDGGAPLIIGPDRRPRLDLQRPAVRTALCSAYQGLCRVFLEAKQFSQAEYIRVMAVRDLGFPQSLFDDIFKEFKLVPPPIPPRPQQPAAPATAPAVPKKN